MKFIAVAVIFTATFAFTHSQAPCRTPNGEQGKCISVYDCKPFLDALKNRSPEVVKFMRDSRCGYQTDPLVCCGSVARYQSVSTPPPVTQVTSPLPPINHKNVNLLPNKSTCGKQTFQDKLFGANDTNIDEFPWMALLEYKNRNGNSVGHSCGGVLISDRYVLTAAHCIVGAITEQVGTLFRVRFGEHNLNTEKDCVMYPNGPGEVTEDCADPPVNIDVEEAISHPQYDERSPHKYHDIGIVRLKNKVTFTEFIQPICLPINGERSNVGEDVTGSGWGLTEKGIFSPVKLKANLPVVSNEQCREVFSRLYRVQIGDSQLCAGGQRGIDACKGDSGGPVMRTFPGTTTYFAEGIVSFGAQLCGTPDVPGVYTRIYHYLGWILDNMKP